MARGAFRFRASFPVLELGYDVVSYQWYGRFAPARTPSAIVDVLFTEIAAWMSKPETQARILADGSEPALRTPAESSVYVASEIKRWRELVRYSGATLD